MDGEIESQFYISMIPTLQIFDFYHAIPHNLIYFVILVFPMILSLSLFL